MTNIFHPAPERGHVDFGWLDSHHSFSFGNWYNGEKVHFGALRVLNDDVVKGGNGFELTPTRTWRSFPSPSKVHWHTHKDSTGTEGILSAGDVQIMSAGSGIRHSEYNASHFDPVNFLQIWIFPKQLDIRPRHEKRSFDPEGRINQWQTVVSSHPGDSGLYIYQDARLALTRLAAGPRTHLCQRLRRQRRICIRADRQHRDRRYYPG